MKIACVLSKGSPKPNWTKIEVDDEATLVTEFTARESTFKQAKTRVFPQNVVGDNPTGYASARILQLLADGWSIQKEDPRFSEDRLSFQLPFNERQKFEAAFEILTGRYASEFDFSKWKPRLHDGILCTSASHGEMTLVLVPSAINELVATRVSAAIRCTHGDVSVYDFMSEPIKYEPMLKLHRRYESLGDDVHDRFMKVGITLRPVTFNDLSGHGAFVGF